MSVIELYFDEDRLRDDLGNYLYEKSGFSAVVIRLRSGVVKTYNMDQDTIRIVEIIHEAIREKLEETQ